MSPTHEQILSHIELRALNRGVPLEDVDRHIADELGVPTDYYFAYLLVWGALEAWRTDHPQATFPAANHPAHVPAASGSAAGGAR